MTPDTDTDTDHDSDADAEPATSAGSDSNGGDGAADGTDEPPSDQRLEAGQERCPYCGRPLRDAGIRALHVGEVHDDVWTDAERAAYERARDAETDALFRYHVKVVGALVILIFGLVYTYVFVLV